MKISLITCAVPAGLCFLSVAACTQNTLESEALPPPMKSFYVAPLGSDQNPGTREKPFATLEAARDAIRQFREKDSPLPVRVLIGGGIYRRQKTFLLESRDSGTRQAPVEYAALPGEKPRFIGGQILSSKLFAKINAQDTPSVKPSVAWRMLKVPPASLPDGATGVLPAYSTGAILPSESELFYNGQRLTIARWPNEQRIEADALDLARTELWKAPHEIWVFGSDKFVYSGVLKKVGFPIKRAELPDHGFYFFNILEELDVPGEYFLDGRGLFLLPPDTFGPASEMVLSTLTDPLIKMDNTEFVTLQGLSLEAARGDALQIAGGAHNLVQECQVQNVGRHGILVSGSYQTILNCQVRDVGASGIGLSGGDRATGRHSGTLVAGCEIARVGRRTGHINKPLTWAVQIDGVGHTLSHCEISETSRAAVQLNGYHNIYEYNDLHDVCQETNDQGALYGGSSPHWGTCGNIIRGNYFHDFHGLKGHLSAGIYADCASMAGIVYGNLFANLRTPGGHTIGIMVHGGQANEITGNLFVNVDRTMRFPRCSDLPSVHENWMVKPYLKLVAGKAAFLKYPHSQESAQYPKEKWDAELTLPKFNRIWGNAAVLSGEMLGHDELKKSGFIGSNPHYASLEEAGISNSRNIVLRHDARVLRDLPGFSPADMASVGRRGAYNPLRMEISDFDMAEGNWIPAVEDFTLCGLCRKGSGTARREFRGTSGLYKIALRYRETPGGASRLELSVGDMPLDQWQLKSHDQLWHRRVMSEVYLHNGDEIRLNAQVEGGAAVIVDRLEMLPCGADGKPSR